MTQSSAKALRLDLRGYRCPVPVIRLEAALRAVGDEAVVTALADDPVAAVDIPHFCRQGGYVVRRLPDQDGAFVFAVGPKTKPR